MTVRAVFAPARVDLSGFGSNGYKGLTVIPGPGAASSAYPGWFKVRRGAGSYVDVKFTSDATRETLVVTLHRTADNKIPSIKIEVNGQTVEPQQLYNAGGRFNIPRAKSCARREHAQTITWSGCDE